MNSKYKDLTKNTALFAISSFGTKVLSFLLVPLYTNSLSTKEYGIADILSTTTTLLIVVMTINIADGVLVFAMDKKNNPLEILFYGLSVMYKGWGILLVAATVIWGLKITAWPDYYYIFTIIYFLISVLYQIFSNYLRAINKVKDVAIAGIISSLVYILGNIICLLVINIGLTGYLISTIIGPLAGVLYCLVKIKIPIKRYTYSPCTRNIQKAILKYCFPLIFNSIALWVNNCLDRYFVTSICGVDQNGIYSIANKIPIILSTVYTVFSQAWNLSAIKEFDKYDTDGFFSKTYATYNAVMTITCSGLILLNIPLAKILYAREFFAAWKYSSVLLYAIFFNSLTAFIGSFFSAQRKSDILAITTLVSALINTFLNMILIPTYGVLGAAIATAIAMVIMWIVRVYYVKKIINLKVNWTVNLIGYILICTQIILEHTKNHAYVAQSITLITILLLYQKEVKQMLLVFLGSLQKVKKI